MKKLRLKLVCIVAASLAAVFLVMMAVLYFSKGSYSTMQADGMTCLISDNNGMLPNYRPDRDFVENLPAGINFNAESEYRTRYFIVYMDESGDFAGIDLDHIAAVSGEEAFEMAQKALERGDDAGYVGHYRFLVTESMVIFLDCSDSNSTRNTVLVIFALAAIAIMTVVTVIFMALSKKTVEPFEENAKKQKQFITDASHELKTPLAIISANAEVLQYKSGENEWTKNIVEQTKRMSKLIGDLLTLAKTDEMGDFVAERIDFSETAEKTAGEFAEVAERKNVEFKTEFAPETFVMGSREQLARLISVLTENAAKYVTDGGEIDIKLEKAGKNAVFTIYNTAKIDGRIDCARLFDRFYRADNSHSSETGGHGIGLSIAAKIALQHGGTLSAKQVKDGIVFTATLPLAAKA